MFSFKMEGSSGLLLLLILTGLLGPYKSYLFPSSSYASLHSAEKSTEKVVLLQGTSLRIKTFCAYQYLQGKHVWCKAEQHKECQFEKSVNLTEPGWQYLTSEQNQKVILEGEVNGCISLLMQNLQTEDSGRYWFGILAGKKIVSVNTIKVVVHDGFYLPSKMSSPPAPRRPPTPKVIGMKVDEVSKNQGESLNAEFFCSLQYAQAEKVWCKEELQKECNLKEPVSLSGPGWKYFTTKPNQRVIINDSGNGCVYIFMSSLQSEDAGIYWFGILDGLSVIPLRKIRVIVQKGQQKKSLVTATSEYEQRVYQVVWILVSIAVGITIAAAFTLVAMVFIKKKKRAADDLNFDDNPNCRVITLQAGTARLQVSAADVIYRRLEFVRRHRNRCRLERVGNPAVPCRYRYPFIYLAGKCFSNRWVGKGWGKVESPPLSSTQWPGIEPPVAPLPPVSLIPCAAYMSQVLPARLTYRALPFNSVEDDRQMSLLL